MSTVAPERILKELADLWVTLGQESGAGEGSAGAGVLRSCSMTMVVIAEASEDPAALGETIAALMPEHPARTIVIRLSGAGERALSERVYAQCWRPFGQHQQICCEQVEITASDAALADVSSVVRPLAVADLPLIVWCRSARLAAMPEFAEIAGMASKVIVDTTGQPDPAAALRRLADSSRAGLALGDLAWTRLTRWRETLAQVFENREHAARLGQIGRVAVEFSPELATSAYYMAAWVADALKEAGARLSAVEVLPGPYLHVELAGEGLSVILQRRDGRFSLVLNGAVRPLNLPPPDDYFLMREELAIARRDPVFEKALASAARLAYPTDK